MKLVNITGFNSSGATAVRDYLSEYSDFEIFPNEFKFLRIKHGVIDLYNSLFIRNLHPFEKDLEVKRFIKSMKSKEDAAPEQSGSGIFSDEEIQTGKRKYEKIVKDIDPSQFGTDDLTGYNFAKEAFKYVSSTIQNDYLLLSNKKDRLVYYQYLVIHLSYRFSQWAEEMRIAE
jgi:hypothetical protein